METPRSEQAQTMSRSQASQLRLLISCWCADERASMPTRHGSSYKSHHHAMKKSAEKSAKQVNTALLATLRPASFQTNHSPACTNMKLLEEKLEFGHEADCKCSQAVLQIVSSLVYIIVSESLLLSSLLICQRCKYWHSTPHLGQDHLTKVIITRREGMGKKCLTKGANRLQVFQGIVEPWHQYLQTLCTYL